MTAAGVGQEKSNIFVNNLDIYRKDYIMGIILDSLKKRDGEFVYAVAAMEYLAFVENNQVNFRQIGEFLHEYRFADYMAGAAYHRTLEGVYYDA